ncbi:MAG: hypothetical protein JST40_06390 [Armatimonadetes bacterium]|nr:hypothetical protein [Armatimonadota bacterium]
MKSVAQIFVDGMKNRFGELSPYWPLGMPIALGDYGTMNRGVFTRLGNVFDEELVETDLNDDITGPMTHHEFKSEGKVSTSFKLVANANLPGNRAKAEFAIDFAGEDAFYFTLAGARVRALKKVASLGQKLIELDKQYKWKREYCVVTTLLEAEEARFIVSGSSTSSVGFDLEFASTTTSPQLDLGTSWKKTREQNLSYEYEADNGPDTPFFRLHKVSKSTFGSRHWGTMMALTRGTSVIAAGENVSDAITESEAVFEPVDVS